MLSRESRSIRSGHEDSDIESGSPGNPSTGRRTCNQAVDPSAEGPTLPDFRKTLSKFLVRLTALQVTLALHSLSPGGKALEVD